MQCRDVRALLPTMGGDAPVDLRVQRHVDECAACRNEAHRYQRMLQALGDLRHVHVDAPVGLLGDTLAAVGGPSVVRELTARQKAAVAGAVGAVAAGAAATAVLVARKRGFKLATVLAR